jgi:hypothetical protein
VTWDAVVLPFTTTSMVAPLMFARIRADLLQTLRGPTTSGGNKFIVLPFQLSIFESGVIRYAQ